MRAFNRISPDAWEMATEYFPKPWPRDLAVADLEHHRSAMHRGAKFPGRPTLCRRWGWTEWAVRDLVKEIDPTGVRQRSASGPPAVRQREDVATPTIEPEPPAARQPAASKPPSRDPYSEEPEEPQEEEQQIMSITDPPQSEVVVPLHPAEPDPPPDPRQPSSLDGLWEAIGLAYLESGHGKAPLGTLAGRRRDRLKRCVVALGDGKEGLWRVLRLWHYWLYGPNDWWRTARKGPALVSTLLKHTEIDQRELAAGEWQWSGRHEAEPPDRTALMSPWEREEQRRLAEREAIRIEYEAAKARRMQRRNDG